MKKGIILMMSMLAFAACAPKSGAPALDLTDLDTTASPKVDFYQYATGGWQQKNPLRPEFSRYGSFDAIRERTQENLNALFESMTTLEAKPGTVDQKISDLYKMALDSTTRNQLGAQPILPYIAQIQAVETRDQLAALLGEMNRYGEGGFLGAGVEADLANSDMQVLYLGQGGLGMGDRDYYLKEENQALYDGYQAYLVKVLGLAGVQDAEDVAQKDLTVETALARIFWSREQNRDMQAIYNPMSSQEIYQRWPGLRFDKLCAAAGIPDQEKVIVQQPSYFDGLSAMLEKCDLETLKAYLLCQFVSGQAGALSDDFYTASWEFFSHQMAGAKEQQPRWKRAMSVPNGLLGEAVGEMYVQRYFPESSKQKMSVLVENLRTALGEHIDALEWMSDTTKARAREKLAAFTVKIGYPDKWKDYSTLDINPENTYYENLRNASAWYVKDNLDKLGKPTDKTEWGMTPQTVNAYYNPTTNEICFPAAILQKPFFDPDADDPVNYGGIGVVIGHEMSHGFDDQGSMFDANGNMVNWWTAEDKAKFDALGDKLVAQFDEVEILPGVKANGRYTLGENIGDHGGLSIAFTAMENATAGKKDPMIDGFTRAQRFYLSYGAIWAQNITDQEKARLTNLDPHSLAVNRVNVSVRNFQTFFDAWDIHEGDPMFRPEQERVHIW
ncbi:MAG: M13 family metallopeptidase [Candidatus Cryptobacteroides sp.]|nr:M13 family metallopeptidase [Candidatus Cryptobacteroides sp.]